MEVKCQINMGILLKQIHHHMVLGFKYMWTNIVIVRNKECTTRVNLLYFFNNFLINSRFVQGP